MVEKIGTENKNFLLEFSRKSVASLEPIRNSTPCRLYANDCPEGPLSNHGSRNNFER